MICACDILTIHSLRNGAERRRVIYFFSLIRLVFLSSYASLVYQYLLLLLPYYTLLLPVVRTQVQ